MTASAERPTSAPVEGPQWSATAAIWDEYWGGLSDPARELIVERASIGQGTRVLDMGCGSGEFLRLAADRGAHVSGIDAAEGMLALARERLPVADLRQGPIEALPWADGSFDVVTGFNSFQFAADREAPFREGARVARGGRVAICVWGEHERCQLRAVFSAIDELAGQQGDAGDPAPPRLGEPGVLAAAAAAAGLTMVEEGEVQIPYEAPDLDWFVRACELDVAHLDPPEPLDPAAVRAAIEESSAPARREDGSYRFENVFRWLLAAA